MFYFKKGGVLRDQISLNDKRMTEIKLIPTNNQSNERVNQELKKIGVVPNVEMFITMFNSGLLDTRNPKIEELSKKIEMEYKNIAVSGKNIVVESLSEFACKNTINILSDYLVMLNLKRIANQLVQEGNDPNRTKIVFLGNKKGIPMIEIGENNLTEHWTASRIVQSVSQFANNVFTKRILKDYKNDIDSCCFLIEDVIDTKDDFLEEVQNMVLQNTFIENNEEENKEQK